MQPYIPDTLPLQGLDLARLVRLIGPANAALARYDGLLQSIPNPELMLAPLTTREAVLSSKIEGTQATVDEVLEQDAGIMQAGEKYQDIQEITNYRHALQLAHNHLKDYPIRLSFVQGLHRELMNSVRGQDKTPGEFRREQNWIGHAGCTIEQATFVPPNPLQLRDYLQAWEHYINSDDHDVLVQTAIMHAQFELLHPFKDGNGRIGRILIPLFLYQKQTLAQPMFYLSEYLEFHREEYYERLRAISADSDWNGWITFFLQAIITQAAQNSARVTAIRTLYEETKHIIHNATHSQYAVHVLDALFNKPIFRTSDLAKYLYERHGIHEKTVLSLLRTIRETGMLSVIKPGSGRRPATLCFQQLVNLVDRSVID
jgi:Fic family protein